MISERHVSYSNKNHSEGTVRFTMASRSLVYVILLILLPDVVISSDKIEESGGNKVEDEEKIDLKHAKDKYKLKGRNAGSNLPRSYLSFIERFLCKTWRTHDSSSPNIL